MGHFLLLVFSCTVGMGPLTAVQENSHSVVRRNGQSYNKTLEESAAIDLVHVQRVGSVI